MFSIVFRRVLEVHAKTSGGFEMLTTAMRGTIMVTARGVPVLMKEVSKQVIRRLDRTNSRSGERSC
jgi:hypothetical protein